MKIIDYGIVTATKNTPLGDGVQALIPAGWQPYGSPYLDRNGVEKQAMVKYEGEAETDGHPEGDYAHKLAELESKNHSQQVSQAKKRKSKNED